jgi:HD-GYP domain-containing protein (c-di-GMP phosphodiesterase class II)
VLRGEAIPIESRILAVAGAWSAMTGPGTRALTPGQAVAALTARAGTDFDPTVVAAAIEVTEREILAVDPAGPRTRLASLAAR